jgi:hypothetical protein
MTETSETKPTNPKDVLAQARLPIGVVPSTVLVALTVSLTEGALKYGRHKWRIAGVSNKTYHDACLRHLERWWNGEECDPVTTVPHLYSALACLAILVDAKACNMVTDDRPPSCNLSPMIADAVKIIEHLKATLPKDTKQYSIADKPFQS